MNRIYQERVFSGLLAILPGGFGLALLVAFIYGKFFRTFEDQSSVWYFLGTGLVLLLVAINFSLLNITVSDEGVTTRFGIISHRVPLSNIAGSYRDKASSISYGGFGIRWGRVNGKRRLVYDVTDAPRVVIRQKQDYNREFVFSTRNPDAVIKAIRSVAGQGIK